MTLKQKAKYVSDQGYTQIWQYLDCPKAVNDAYDYMNKQ